MFKTEEKEITEAVKSITPLRSVLNPLDLTLIYSKQKPKQKQSVLWGGNILMEIKRPGFSPRDSVKQPFDATSKGPKLHQNKIHHLPPKY